MIKIKNKIEEMKRIFLINYNNNLVMDNKVIYKIMVH